MSIRKGLVVVLLAILVGAASLALGASPAQPPDKKLEPPVAPARRAGHEAARSQRGQGDRPDEVGGWEMTTYYVGFLYRGPKWTAEKTPETERLQESHMANILRMAEAGKLLVAGPFSDDGALRGLYVFKVDSIEEAEKLVQTDPAVQAGRLRFELHPWFAAKNIVVTPHAAPAPPGR